MYKLVILIEPSQIWEGSEDRQWPEFLRLVESLPGLKREAASRVEADLYGVNFAKMHELFFDSRRDAERAMSTKEGQEAGRLLQSMTGGHMTLFFAEHHEDSAENLRKYREGKAASV